MAQMYMRKYILDHCGQRALKTKGMELIMTLILLKLDCVVRQM